MPNQALNIICVNSNGRLGVSPLDFAKIIGVRIRKCRGEKGWTLGELSAKTGGTLSLQRISNYEQGRRTPGPAEAKILAKALGTRAAWIMALEETQTQLTKEEESLVKHWRVLPENERMAYARRIEQLAMVYRDPVPDEKLAGFSAKEKEKT